MAQSERYKQHRAEVYRVYGISKNDRKKYSMHHIVCRHDVGNLVPHDFDIDAKSNLYPLIREVHQHLHTRLDYLEG